MSFYAKLEKKKEREDIKSKKEMEVWEETERESEKEEDTLVSTKEKQAGCSKAYNIYLRTSSFVKLCILQKSKKRIQKYRISKKHHFLHWGKL